MKVVKTFLCLFSSIVFFTTTAGQEAGYAICVTCHGADGAGNIALNSPAIAGQESWYLETPAPQIHVLSEDGVGVANHIHLHAVQSLFTRDVVHSAEVGALVGLVGVILVLGGAYLLDLPDEIIGWMPYIFLSIVIFGFCTWEGGLIGIQRPNYHPHSERGFAGFQYLQTPVVLQAIPDRLNHH